MKKWNQLPKAMQTPEVKEYYDILKRKGLSLFFKRIFDIVVSGVLITLISGAYAIYLGWFVRISSHQIPICGWDNEKL